MYKRLCTAFYDAEKPEASADEVDFYARYIPGTKGPVLEAMCGSGRLLIPLAKRGYPVEGVDNSSEMIESLLQRRPDAIVYRQGIESLSLPKKYPLIFIALGSFQLLPEELVADALKSLHAQLAPGGMLLLDTFIPWDLIEGEPVRKAQRRAGNIHLDQVTEVDVERRRYVWRNRYERGGETEDETMTVRWYFPGELTALLEAAGFSVTVHGTPVTGPRPRRYVYEARNRAKP